MTNPLDVPKVLPTREHVTVLSWVLENIEDLWRRAEALHAVALSALRNGYTDHAAADQGPDRVDVQLDRAVWVNALRVATTPLPPLPEMPDG
jgi:hypothetical protein